MNISATGTPIFAVTDEGSEVDYILSQYSKGKAVNSWALPGTIRSLDDFANEVDSGVESPEAAAKDKELTELFSIDRLSYGYLPVRAPI